MWTRAVGLRGLLFNYITAKLYELLEPDYIITILLQSLLILTLT